MYPRDTAVTVHSFTRQQDGEEIVIGSPESGIFLAVPTEAVEVLDQLADGKTVGEVIDLHKQKYGEEPDLDDFLGLLEAKGFVQTASIASGKSKMPPLVQSRPAQKKYHFSNFSRSWAERIFSLPVLVMGSLVTIVAAGAGMRHPSLVAGPGALYFPDHRTLSWTILIAANYATLFAHEFCHLVAGRALGINSRMGISHRLWYLVAETDLTGLWSVPKRKRYLPLIAGTLLDAFSAGLLILVLFAQEERWFLLPILATRLLRAMIFLYLARIVWQCFFFVRTDFYYVIANFFNCKNLLGDTEGYLRNRLSRLVRAVRPVDQSAVPDAEWRVIRAYAWLWLAGRAAALIALIVVTLPLLAAYARNLAGAFRTGYSANPSGFVDAVLTSGYFLLSFTAGLSLWLGAMVRRRFIGQNAPAL